MVGLRGTGSKDVIVKDAFVPDYRTMDAMKVMDGTAQIEAGMTKTLYQMPWSTMFPLGISSATIGICEGALAAHLDYQRERVGANGTAIKDDPYVMYAVGEAAADINAARQEMLANVDRIYDIVDAGKEVSFEDRAAGRRTQVRAVWRAVAAVDQIFSRSGGNALRMDKPLQRYWRDAHAGCRPRHPRARHRLPRIGAELARRRPAGSAAGDDLRRPPMSDLKSLGYVKVQATDIPTLAPVRVRRTGFRRGHRPDRRRPLPADGRARRAHHRRARRHRQGRHRRLGGPRPRRAGRVKATLEAAGVPFKELSLAEADARRVEEVITFDDPAGTSIEVFHGAVLDHSPVVTPFGARFVTGEQGLGHVVLPALDVPGLFDFYTEVLGFLSRGAFRVPAPPEFGPLRVRFLGINERHHSLAICPAMTRRDPG